MEAWYMDPSEEQKDPRELHQYEDNKPVNQELLDKLGVLHWKFDEKTPEDLQKSPKLQQIR